MRSSTLKGIIFISTLLVTLIVAIQLFWLYKVYSFEQKQFNTNIVKSIRGLLEDMQLADFPGVELQKLIEHPNPNTFLVQIDAIPSRDSLKYFLINEFEDFGVLSD